MGLSLKGVTIQREGTERDNGVRMVKGVSDNKWLCGEKDGSNKSRYGCKAV